MLYLVIYDITNNSLRSKLAEKLKDYGLERIQYSAFIGHLKKYELNSLLEDIKKLLTSTKWDEEENVRNIQLYPIPELSRKTRIEISYQDGKMEVYRGEEVKDTKKVAVV